MTDKSVIIIMGKKKRQKLSPDKRKEQIFISAIKCFTNKGYAQTNVDEIAETAGIAKGTIYLYFKDKQDLFLALYREWMERTIKNMDKVLASNLSAGEKIKRLGQLIVEGLNSGEIRLRTILELYIHAFDDFKSFLLAKEIYREISARVEKILREGVEKGEFRKELDISSLTLLICNNLDMIDLVQFLSPYTIDLEKHWEEVFQVLMNGILIPRKGS